MWSLPHGALDRRCVAPPCALPWQAVEEEACGASTEYCLSRLAPSAKNVLRWRPGEGGREGEGDSRELVVVVGDSYVDDVDMGFETWPSLLARARGASYVCTARGGSRIAHARPQLARAHEFVVREGHGQRFPATHRWLIVHTGGNDILRALLLPPLLLLLWIDLLRLSLVAVHWFSMPTRAHRFSFIGLLSSHTSKQLKLLLHDAHAAGYRRVVLSRLPLSPSVPLARAVCAVMLLGLASSQTITATLQLCFDLFGAGMDEALADFAAEAPTMRVEVFDEAAHLGRLAAIHAADTFSLSHVPILVKQRLARNAALWWARPRGETRRPTGAEAGASQSRDAPLGTDFWHDAHHPAHEAHLALAQHAAACFKG